MTSPVYARTLLLAALAASAACRGRDAAAGDATTAHPPEDSAVVAATIARFADREPGALHAVVAVSVIGFTGPGDQPFSVTMRTADPVTATSRRFGTITMRTSLRERAAELGQYPCTSCHLGRRLVLVDERRRDAHQNIKVEHPQKAGAVCSTCHSADNVEFLALRNGERATLDHTYRLCAQCHFAQADAWAGGGHGKRLDGWQGRRVVMGCADCHDPHEPAITSRIPFRAPQIERIRGPIP